MKAIHLTTGKLMLSLLISSLLVIAACKKSDTSANTATTKPLTVHLSDDPSVFDAVFIDIRTVEVKIDTNLEHDGNFDNEDHDQDNDHKDHDRFGKWDTLSIRAGVYDIMKFRNGLDTVLGKAILPNSRIEKVRITLGDQNTVIVNKVSHPLQLGPGTTHYAYVKIDENDLDEADGKQDLFIDFDLAESIREINGNYYLRPFLKAYGMGKFGRIEGKVGPAEAKPVVKATLGTDVFTAVPNHEEGEYKLMGLKEGTYSVTFTSSTGYMDTTINNVKVIAGQELHLPQIIMHK